MAAQRPAAHDPAARRRRPAAGPAEAEDVLLWSEPTDRGVRLRSATQAGDGWERTEELGDASAGTLQVAGGTGHQVAAWIADAGATVATADAPPTGQ